jgi:hypothetical protein
MSRNKNVQLRPLLLLAGIATGFLPFAFAPSSASADPGQTTRTVNLRQCASTRCPSIRTIPAGAYVEVIDREGSWYEVDYRGIPGFVFAAYVAVGGYYEAPPIYRTYPEPFYFDFRIPRHHRRHHDGWNGGGGGWNGNNGGGWNGGNNGGGWSGNNGGGGGWNGNNGGWDGGNDGRTGPSRIRPPGGGGNCQLPFCNQ